MAREGVILVTGSAGHLGEALIRTLRAAGRPARGIDRLASPYTDLVGSITDPELVARAMAGATAVLHTATLHKPHVASHTRQDFIDTNITGTPARPARSATRCRRRRTRPPPGSPRRSRRWPRTDARDAFAGANLKANEYLNRRVDLEDAVAAHLCALDRADALPFGRYIISATTPFSPDDVAELRRDAPAVAGRRVPGWRAIYDALGWRMPATLDRVYDNTRARAELGWQPRHDFASVIARVRDTGELASPLARAIGVKGYHAGDPAVRWP